MNKNTANLEKLADIISDIDSAKNENPGHIPHLLLAAGVILDQMKMELQDIGNLPEIFQRMEWLQFDFYGMKPMPQFIEEAHAEVMRLLGDDLDLVYCPAEEEEVCHA